MSPKPDAAFTPELMNLLRRDHAPIVGLDAGGKPITKITACYLRCDLCGAADDDLSDPVGGAAARRLALSRGWAVFTPSLTRISLRATGYTVGQLVILRDLRTMKLERAKAPGVEVTEWDGLIEQLKTTGAESRDALADVVRAVEVALGQAGVDRTVDLCARCTADVWRQA